MPITEPTAIQRESAGVVGASTKTPPLALPTRSRLWIWFVVAFAVQLAVWIGLFVVAAHHPVEEVPLATPSTR